MKQVILYQNAQLKEKHFEKDSRKIALFMALIVILRPLISC